MIELATNEEALAAIYRGTTDYQELRNRYELSPVNGEKAAQLMQLHDD